MNLNDYIIDHSDFDWPQLLEFWGWLLPDKFTVWTMNRIGDLFIITNDGAVHMLDVGAGSLKEIAQNKDELCNKMNEPQFAADKLMMPLVNSLVASGLVLSKGECYSYKFLPIFGGAYEIDNFVIKTVAYHFAAFGPMHEKIKDQPDGSRITFKVVN